MSATRSISPSAAATSRTPRGVERSTSAAQQTDGRSRRHRDLPHLIASIEKPVRFISAGIFKAPEDTFRHSQRVINSFEIIIGIDGVLYIAENGEEFEIRDGGMAVLYPSIPHGGYRDSGRDTSFFWAHFTLDSGVQIYPSLDEVPDVSRFLDPSHPLIGDRILLPKYLERLESERLSVICRELLHVHESSYYTEMAVNLCLTSLLVEITQQYLGGLAVGEDQTDVVLNHVLRCIKLNYLHEYSVRDISRELGYNADYLARVFRSKMGMKISDYVNASRIEKAKKTLLGTNKPIKVIAFELGFGDEKYFMKVFKKNEGVTPTEYRRTWYRAHYNSA